MFKPVNGVVLVKPDAPIEKKGKIFLPPLDEKQHCGIVQQSDSPICKAGDLIAYTRFFPMTVRGVDMVTVDAKSIIGVDDAPAALPESDGVSREASPPLIVPRPTFDMNHE